MRFKHTKKTSQLIAQIERIAPFVRSGEISLAGGDFDDLKGRIIGKNEREGVGDKISTGAYIIKRSGVLL